MTPDRSQGGRCCNEHGCSRKKTPVLRRSDLSGRWYLILDYTREGEAIVAKTGARHDVTDEVLNAVVADVLTKLVNAGVPRKTIDPIARSYRLQPKGEASGA